MYLLVFVTLIIAVIGTYAQVAGLQAARMFANQHLIASTMMQWHTAAVSMAASIIRTNPGSFPGTGCSISYTIPAGTGMTRCPSPNLYNNEHNTPTATGGTITNANGLLNRIYAGSSTTGNECVHLPSSCTSRDTPGYGCANGACAALYDTVDFQFYSVLYQDPVGGQNLVLTYVQAPLISAANPKPGYLNLAGGNQINVTGADLLQQLHHIGIPNFSYGTINGTNQLVTGGSTYNLQGPMLGAGRINGAIAVVTSPDGY